MSTDDARILAAYQRYRASHEARDNWHAELLAAEPGATKLSELTRRTPWPLTVTGAHKHIATARKRAAD